MRRKLLATAAIAIAGVLGTANAASANDCLNLSRPLKGATPFETEKGRWLAVDFEEPGLQGWLFQVPENFMNGQADALLGNATCPTARLVGQSKGEPDPANLHGIWSEECFEKALGGL